MTETFYDAEDGSIIHKKGTINFFRTDWKANSEHEVFANKNVRIATNGKRPWNQNETCSDILCADCKIWFKCIKTGFEFKDNNYDLFQCPKCKSKFMMR